MRNSRQNLEIAERILDAVANAISDIEVPPETHIALANTYISLAVAQREDSA